VLSGNGAICTWHASQVVHDIRHFTLNNYLCRTAGRKEKAIRSRFAARKEKALARLEKRVAEGKLKDRLKMERHLGRIQALHPQVADLYEMAVRDTEQGPRFLWRQKSGQRRWLEAREGAYLLRCVPT
jgi:hypothetical protein